MMTDDEYIVELKAQIDRLTSEILEFSDAEFVYFMHTLLAQRSTGIQVDFEQKHYFLGLAFRAWRYADEDPVPGESDIVGHDKEGDPIRWKPWELNAVALPDASFYSHTVIGSEGFVDYSEAIFQFGACDNCGSGLVAGLKTAVCPICGESARLT